ncbi:hypothetical protein F2P81_016777 [Scophthalmus maximus]|uniref:Uncharacterized protein n=1 Tax=Scophthalmus maximus TaxID=52904 RepID=A0A6A4S4A1_SCOMX|nr:hypothetical protein F2P81_016777 [Scophthalmus maximus]
MSERIPSVTVSPVHSYVRTRVLCRTQVVWGSDEVTILNPPEEPSPGRRLDILHSCDGAATVQLDCVVTFDTGLTSTFPLRRWRCIPGDPKVRTVVLNLPDWLVYRADGIVPDSQWVLSCFLRASLRYGRLDDTEGPVAAKDVAALQPKPFFSRPVKRHRLCVAWSTRVLQLTPRFSKKQCPFEKETVRLLSSIYASTGENFGITKTLDPYGSEVLEYLRVEAISFSWCLFSIWVFVTRHCQQESKCGVFHHIDSDNNYVTPTLFITNSGQLHIQVNGQSDESFAFLSPFKVPLGEWCQLGVTLQGAAVTVSMVCLDEGQRTVVRSSEHVLSHAVRLDDTDGYFVIGGGEYTRGVEGYFGPVVYQRNRITPLSEADVPGVIEDLDLTGWLRTCQKFRLELSVKIRGSSPQARRRTESGSGKTCRDVFHEWLIKDLSSSQCGQWEAAVLRRRQAAKLSQLLVFKHGGKAVGLPAVGRALYSLSLHKLGRASGTGVVSRILPLLLQAGCLADNRALHMSSVLYATGFGVERQLSKAWLLALLAAQKDDRLALLHLGHMHHQGLHGLPADPDLAYAYYANIAKQTTLDHQHPTPEQTFVEALYLNNDEMLNLQTNEDHHIFQWLKLQARRGAAEAEGFVPAMNALAWYYEQFERDYEQAVQLWEKADLLESPDAALNLGVMYFQGLYPGKAADQYMAYKYYLKSAERGHVRGALLLADIWTTGLPGQVNRRPSDAVLLATYPFIHITYHTYDVCLRQDEVLVFPPTACSHSDEIVVTLCVNRADFWILLLRHGVRGDITTSQSKVKTLTLTGWYNLGLLAEDGYRLPLSVLTELGLSHLYLADHSLLLSALYKRCRDSEDNDAYLPCSLALFNVHLQLFQKNYSAAIKCNDSFTPWQSVSLWVDDLQNFRWAIWPVKGKRAVPVVRVQRRQREETRAAVGAGLLHGIYNRNPTRKRR